MNKGKGKETHPVFKLAMEQYRYWAKPINNNLIKICESCKNN